MKIKIEQKNGAKITAELDAVNGKAVQFTVRFWTAVAEYATAAEKRLERSQLPKAERKGVRVTVTPAGPAAKAYKYAAKSTSLTIERGSSGWFLVGIASTEVYPGQSERMQVTISETQRDRIAAKAVEGYRVKAASPAMPIAHTAESNTSVTTN
jgi:hypothetical protein